MSNVRSSCVVLILLAAVVTNAAAQALPPDDEAGEENTYSWGLGVAGMAMQKPYVDIDRDYMPIPVTFSDEFDDATFGKGIRDCHVCSKAMASGA